MQEGSRGGSETGRWDATGARPRARTIVDDVLEPRRTERRCVQRVLVSLPPRLRCYIQTRREINRAMEIGESLGFAKLLVDGDTDMLIGAAILGPDVDELVDMLAAHMYSGIHADLRESVLVHPTISELIPWILDDLLPVGANRSTVE